MKVQIETLPKKETNPASAKNTSHANMLHAQPLRNQTGLMNLNSTGTLKASGLLNLSFKRGLDAADPLKNQISRAVSPKTVAVLGASSNKLSLGGITVGNIMFNNYTGTTYANAPKGEMIIPDGRADIVNPKKLYEINEDGSYTEFRLEKGEYTETGKADKIQKGCLIRLKAGNSYYLDETGQMKVAKDKTKPRQLHIVSDFDQIPNNTDLGVIVVPAKAVPSALDKMGEKNFSGAFCITKGFAEEGNHDLQEQIVNTANKHQMALMGPNGVGLINMHPDISLNASFLPRTSQFQEGDIAFLSNSGAMGAALGNVGLKVNHFISVGNGAQFDVARLLNHYKDDPGTKAIACYMESFGHEGPKTRKALFKASKQKPVIIVKAGRSQAAAAASAAHTGAAATGYAPIEKLFNSAGVLTVDKESQLAEYIDLFTKDNLLLPEGKNVSVVSNGGGAGTLITDNLEMSYVTAKGNELESGKHSESTVEILRSRSSNKTDDNPKPISDKLHAVLKDVLIKPENKFVDLPTAGSIDSNPNSPVDTDAAINPDIYLKTIGTILEDDKVDSAIAYLVPVGQTLGQHNRIIKGIDRLQKAYNKPVMVVMHAGKETMDEMRAQIAQIKQEDPTSPPIHLYDKTDKAVQDLAVLSKRGVWLKENKDVSAPPVKTDVSLSKDGVARAREVLKTALTSALESIEPGQKEIALDTHEASQVLNSYGISIKSLGVAREEDPVKALEEHNKNSDEKDRILLDKDHMVVAKILSKHPNALHKSDIGGVKLKIKSAEELRKAKDEIIANAGEHGVPPEAIDGIQVQEMVKGDYELYLGTNKDNSTGINVLEYGMGGTKVDIYNKNGFTDTAVIPFTEKDATRLIENSATNAFFATNKNGKAYRGMIPADKEQMKQQLLRTARLAEDFPEIKAININPFKIEEETGEVKAVDARITFEPEDAKNLLERLS